MRGTLLLLSLFVQDPYHLHIQIIAVWLHHFDRLTHRKFISLLDPAQSVFYFTHNSQIGVFSYISIAVIDLTVFIRSSVEKSGRKLPVGTVGDLFQIPGHILSVKFRIFLIIINGFSVSSCHRCHIQRRLHPAFNLQTVDPRFQKFWNMFNHAKIFGIENISSTFIFIYRQIFGADAVYIGGEAFGLRAKAKNFSMEEMKEGIEFAHARDVKVYVTANILAHNRDLDGVREYFKELKEIKPDALIIADPGVFEIAKEVCPEIERHISTQANNTNYETYRFWYRQGAKRVVSARELSMEELKELRANIPDDLEIETFIHGAMCISYSGRCLLSN